MINQFKNKRILFTGACEAVGSELIRQLRSVQKHDDCEVIGIDNKEKRLFFLDQLYRNDSSTYFFVLDIRDKDELSLKMKGIDVVFHSAALKHVII